MTDAQLLKATLKYHRITYAEAAKAMNINRDTFARRLRSNGFLLKDVQALAKLIPLNGDEILSIFFPDSKKRKEVNVPCV